MSGVTWRGGARRGGAVVMAALLVAACADDNDDPISAPSTAAESTGQTTTSAPPTTTVVETTVVETTITTAPDPTTTSSTTSTTTVTETTEPRDVPHWTHECSEVTADVGRPYASDPGLEVFTALGAAPTLDLLMPEVVTSAGPSGSIAGTVPIPGGVLVGIYPPDSWPVADEMLTSSSLVAVDHDGTIRWRRCFDDDLEARRFAVAPAALEPEVAWVLSTPWNGPGRIVGVDLATGADVEFPSDVTDFGERGDGSRRFAVLGPRFADGPVEADARLVLIDALDGTTAEIPVPPSWAGGEGGWVQVIEDDTSDAGYVLVDGFPGPGESAAVYRDGAWTDDPAVQRAQLPLQVTETFGEPFELRLLDGAGDLIWSVPDFHGISREGFHWAVADDVVLAMRCVSWKATDGSCGWVGDEPPQEELVAFDIDTGQELWAIDGSGAVPVLAGDRAIVNEWDEEMMVSSGYVLIDLLTGERIGPDGGPWSADAFVQECCGGDVYVNVRRSGGVVVATNTEHVRVWYPPELTTPTVTVDLMS